MKWFSKKFIYFDHASSTPVDIRVSKFINKISKEFFANPSAIHKLGVNARNVVESARDSVARALSAHSDEIIFTGSGTESNALAILGLVSKFHEQNTNQTPHIITTNAEHQSVIENCKMLEDRGLAEITYVPINMQGIVEPKYIAESIKPNTILVSVIYANNEIGTINPIMEIAKVIRKERKRKHEMQILSRVGATGERVKREEFAFRAEAPFLHIDACQAMNYLFTENVEKLGVDMMSFNSSKIYGPKGVAVLYKKRAVNLASVYAGGGQEMGLRSGTENTAGIASMARALEITNAIKDYEQIRLSALRDFFFSQIPKLENETGYKIHINGDKENRLPNNINISIEGISSELLVIELDAQGIAVSSKSACKSESEESSHVIHALRTTGDNFPSEESLRITLGRSSNLKNINLLLKSLKNILSKYKKFQLYS